MQVEGRLPLELKLDVLVDLTDLHVHALHPRQDVDQQFHAVQEALSKIVLPPFAGTLKNENNTTVQYIHIKFQYCTVLKTGLVQMSETPKMWGLKMTGFKTFLQFTLSLDWFSIIKGSRLTKLFKICTVNV